MLREAFSKELNPNSKVVVVVVVVVVGVVVVVVVVVVGVVVWSSSSSGVEVVLVVVFGKSASPLKPTLSSPHLLSFVLNHGSALSLSLPQTHRDTQTHTQAQQRVHTHRQREGHIHNLHKQDRKSTRLNSSHRL